MNWWSLKLKYNIAKVDVRNPQDGPPGSANPSSHLAASRLTSSNSQRNYFSLSSSTVIDNDLDLVGEEDYVDGGADAPGDASSSSPCSCCCSRRILHMLLGVKKHWSHNVVHPVIAGLMLYFSVQLLMYHPEASWRDLFPVSSLVVKLSYSHVWSWSKL